MSTHLCERILPGNLLVYRLLLYLRYSVFMLMIFVDVLMCTVLKLNCIIDFYIYFEVVCYIGFDIIQACNQKWSRILGYTCIILTTLFHSFVNLVFDPIYKGMMACHKL